MTLNKNSYLLRNLTSFVPAFCLFVLVVGSPVPARGLEKKNLSKESSSKGTERKSSARKGAEKPASRSEAKSSNDSRRRAESEPRRGSQRDSARDDSKDRSRSTAKTPARDLVKTTGKRAQSAPSVALTARQRELNGRSSVETQRKSDSTLQSRRRAAEWAEMKRAEERRRAEAVRQAAIARQRAAEETLRDDVQSMIANDDTSGEDPEVRRVAVNALGNHAGTVVIMDPRTGRIYSIVNQAWAIREGFKPCSTIKLVTGLAGLNERVIDPSNTRNISDTNQVDLTKALAHSQNDYFQQVGGQLGFEKMISYARRLGLGEKTGINLPHEFQGQMPVLKSGFALNRMSSHGDDFKVTALQLATLVSAIANGGKLVTPQVTRTRQDETKFKTRVRRSVNIDRDSMQYILPGMVGAVSYGSGRRAHDPAGTVVGKTGTCIGAGGVWVGLFTSFAPLANPRLAVVVIARGPDAHNHFPAAVAGRIYRDLNGRFGASANDQLATRRESFDTQPGPTKKPTRATYATNHRLETEIAVHEDEDLVKAEISESVASTSRRTPASRTAKPVLLSIPKRSSRPAPRQADYTAEVSTSSVEVSTLPASDGQTRPRRVLINER